MKSKYIIVKHSSMSLETPYVFPETEQHFDVARAITRGAMDKVVSAGFCDVGYDQELGYSTWSCWGESVSLGVKSLESDSGTLNSMFRADPYR